MYSRVFTNEGQLYKETPLVIEGPYVFYEHEDETYLTKPGKVYIEPYHSEFNYYLQNYDVAILGSIVVIGVLENGDVEFYFDNPDNMDAIATHYSLTKPFAEGVIEFKADTLMSIRFNSSKVAHLYKGYATKDASNRTPVASMYIDELDDYLRIYNTENDGVVTKTMHMDKDESVLVDWLEADLITIGGVQYRPSDYDYIPHNGYSNTTLQGDPYTNSNVTKLHE